jgi:hypothetical protein
VVAGVLGLRREGGSPSGGGGGGEWRPPFSVLSEFRAECGDVQKLNFYHSRLWGGQIS